MLFLSWLTTLRRRPTWFRGGRRVGHSFRRTVQHRLRSSLLRFHPLSRPRRVRRRLLKAPRRPLFGPEVLETRLMPGDAMASGIIATSLAKGPSDPSSDTKTGNSGSTSSSSSTKSGTSTPSAGTSAPTTAASIGNAGAKGSPSTKTPATSSTGTQLGPLIPSLPAALETGEEKAPTSGSVNNSNGGAPEPSAPPSNNSNASVTVTWY